MNLLRTPIGILIFSLTAFAICRLFLYYSYPEYFGALSTQQLLTALIKGIQFDSATIASSSVLFIALLTLPFQRIQTQKLRRVCLSFISVIVFLLLIYFLVDISYFGEVKRHIGADFLNITSDIGAITEFAFSSRTTEIFYGLALLSVFAIIWYLFIIKPENTQTIKIPRTAITRLCYWLCAVALMVFSIRGFIPTGRPINIADAFTDNGSMVQANLTLNPAYLSFREAQKRIQHQPLDLISKKDTQTFAQQHPTLFKWQHPQAVSSNKNIVVILLESWNYRHIDGLNGTSYKVTPFFDSLIPKSQVWDNYYAAGQRSIVGIQATLSSVPALPSFGTIGFGLEIKNFSRIGDIVNHHGYRSIMMQTSKRRSFQMENIAQALGFTEYYGQEDIPILLDYPQSQPLFGWDYEGLQFLADKLITPASHQQPFFAFLFTGSTHEPFPHLPKAFELYPHDFRAESGYLNALRYSDWSLEQFFSRIRNEPWFNNTIFILTADHTLNMPNENKPNEKNKEQITLSREDFHIPLLIYTPDESLTPKRISHIASQYDLLPTIVDLLGFNQKIYTFGQSLYDSNQNEQAYVFAGDSLGLITQTQSTFFNEDNLYEQEKKLNKEDNEALNHLKLKLQYADELLRKNQWTD